MASAVRQSTVPDAPALETWTLDPQAIRDWAATAKAGEEKIYACERFLARLSEGARVARVLEERRCVALFQRPQGHGIKHYVMRRLHVRKASIAADPEPKARPLDGDSARLLRVLRACARRSQPCPTNRELAKRAAIATADHASYVLKKLVSAGRIAIRFVGPPEHGARVVTILATMAQTAEPLS